MGVPPHRLTQKHLANSTRFERFVRQLRIPGVAPNVAYVGSSAFDDGQLEDDDLLGDTGGYEST